MTNQDITMNRGPVFVGGLSRSGKTLLCSLLAAHPNIAMPSKESNMWTFFYRRYGDLSQGDNFERCLAALLRYKGALLLNPNPERLRKEFWQGEPTYARLFALFHTHYAEQLGKPCWGVQSVSQEFYTDLIFAAYPGAKMISMIRDPRDRYTAKIKRRAQRWREVALATAQWADWVTLAKDHQQRYPHNYKIIRYETLVGRPEETMRAVCAFLNQAYSSAIFANKSNPQYRGQPISPDFVGRFRGVMSRREIAFMQAYTGPDMAAYNYEPEPVRFSGRDHALYHLIDRPINLAWMAGWRTWKDIQFRFPAQMGPALSPNLISA